MSAQPMSSCSLVPHSKRIPTNPHESSRIPTQKRNESPPNPHHDLHIFVFFCACFLSKGFLLAFSIVFCFRLRHSSSLLSSGPSFSSWPLWAGSSLPFSLRCSVPWCVGGFVHRSVARSVAVFVGPSATRLLLGSVGSFGRSVRRFVGLSVGEWFSRSVAASVRASAGPLGGIAFPFLYFLATFPPLPSCRRNSSQSDQTGNGFLRQDKIYGFPSESHHSNHVSDIP